MPCEQHAAFVRRLEAGEHAQQRGLAASRGAEQGEEFAFVEMSSERLSTRGNIAEAFAHRLEAQQMFTAGSVHGAKLRRRVFGGALAALRSVISPR